MPEKFLLKVEEAADALAISRSKAYQPIASGSLPSITIGGRERASATISQRLVAARMAEQYDSGR